MEITVIILSILQAGTLGVLIAIFRQRTIEKTLAQVDANTQALENALREHKASIDKLPKDIHTTFSKEVKLGMKPTVESLELLRQKTIEAFNKKALALENTHNKFHALLSHVADLDNMPDWLNRIEDSIKPLQIVSEKVMHMQNDNHSIFENANNLIRDYSEKGDKVQASYLHLTEVIDKWIAEERISRERFSETVDDHLREFNKLNTAIKNMLGEINNFTETTEGLFEELDKNIPKAVSALVSASEGHREIKRKLNSTLEEIHKFSKSVSDETKEAIQQQVVLKQNMNDFLKKFQSKLDRRPWWKRIFS